MERDKMFRGMNPIMKETIILGEKLGFVYRAHGNNLENQPDNKLIGWVTFTYPDTNSHIIYIDVFDNGSDITKTLGDELVRCGRIQLRQQMNRDFSIFNYD